MARRAPFLVALGITTFALGIRFVHPEHVPPFAAEALRTEAFHIVAHLVLYGTVARLGANVWPRWSVVPAVVALGFVQELAQVVAERPFGGPECFDLGVDALAATVVVWAVNRRRRQSADQAS